MLLILFSFSFAGILLCHRCFTADRNCDEYPCTQNLAGNHSNCCVVALSHLTLGGRLPGQSRVEIPCTFSLSLCLCFTQMHTHAHTHTHRLSKHPLPALTGFFCSFFTTSREVTSIKLCVGARARVCVCV